MGRPDGMCGRVAECAVEAEALTWELPQGAHSLSPAAQDRGVAWGSMGAHGGGGPAAWPASVREAFFGTMALRSASSIDFVPYIVRKQKIYSFLISRLKNQ